MQRSLRAHLQELAAPIVLAVGALSLMAVLGLGWQERNDYTLTIEPGIDALRSGDIGGFLRQGNIEAGSVLLRAPFVLLGELFGGGPHTAYRMLAVPGLIACAVLAVVLWTRVRATGGPGRNALIAVLAISLSPFLFSALVKAHPEEPLAAVLCLGALWAGRRQRWLLGAILVGLAIGTKLWAVVAVIPLLILLDDRRVRTLAVAGITATAVYLPFVIVLLLSRETGTSAGEAVSAFQPIQATQTVGSFKPWQIWWFLGDPENLHVERYGTLRPLYRGGPAWLETASRPLAVLVPITLSLLLAPVLRRRPRSDVLLLLAVALLLRGMLDVTNNVYYALPLIFTLVTWEVVTKQRVSWLMFGTTLTGWTVLTLLPLWTSPDFQAAAYLLWSVPLLGGLLLTLVRPEILPSRRRVPVTAV